MAGEENSDDVPQDSGSLYSVISDGYIPTPVSEFAPLTGRWPIRFCLDAVYEMLKDPSVVLGAALRRAPMLSPIIKLKGPDNLVKFAEEELQRFWMMAMPTVVDGMFFTLSANECIYRRDQGLVRFDRIEAFNPRDIQVLHDGSRLIGFKAAGKYKMTGLKGFLYLHRRRNREWSGQSALDPTFDPWMEKWDYRGAKEARKLWFYKWAFQGGIMIYPKGGVKTTSGTVSYQQIARDCVERIGFGAAMTLEAPGDSSSGNWEYIPPAMNGNPTALTERINSIDTDITRTLEIPDDIVRQDSGTGSYAGRSIPMMSYFIGQKHVLLEFVISVMQQVVYPLLMLNFGAQAKDQVSIDSVDIDIDKLMPIQPAKEGQAVQTPGDTPAKTQQAN